MIFPVVLAACPFAVLYVFVVHVVADDSSFCEFAPSNITHEVDLRYLGMYKYHENSRIPHKNSKYHKLTEEEINENKELARDRIFIEHTNSWIKRFKILSTKFRNSLSHFAKFAVLLCGFYNFDRA